MFPYFNISFVMYIDASKDGLGKYVNVRSNEVGFCLDIWIWLLRANFSRRHIDVAWRQRKNGNKDIRLSELR
jgi:hypothetical protein